METQPSSPLGLALTIIVGLAVGVFNFSLIRLLSIPPIIATLSSQFVILSVAIVWNRGLRIKPPEILGDFPSALVLGIPVLAILVIALALVMHVVLGRTIYGRSVTAIGQSERAARLSGVSVQRVRFTAYVASAVLAALAGLLLASFSGGAALNMGGPYLLTSIAVVVIGGTSVAGGDGNVPGLLGRGAVPLPALGDAQHLRRGRGREADPDRRHRHPRHRRGQLPQGTRLGVRHVRPRCPCRSPL